MAALLTLPACGMVGSKDMDVAAQPAGTQSAASPSAPSAPAPSSKPPPAAVQPAPQAPTASLPQPSPDQLMGLDAQGVTRLLGQPGLKRIEGPAHVWQYANRLCVLDVVMYDDEAKRGLRVNYVELRDPTGGSAVPRNCFRSFLKNPPDGGA
ncbi:MAG: hypothetical protein NTY59_03900 [Alphaproteobacteria bacterium]|nr:hypothetical protein [Alphaproteobacteria bacterium]